MPYQPQSSLGDRPSHAIFNEWDKRLHRIYQDKQVGAVASLMSMFRKEQVQTKVFTWEEKTPHATRHTRVNGAVAQNATSIVVFDASIFSPGQVLHLPATNQDVLLTGIDLATQTLTVVRQNTLDSSLPNLAIADNAVIGVRQHALGQGEAGTETLIRDSSERTSRITTMQREYQWFEDDGLYAVKTDANGMVRERREDAEEAMAEDIDLTFLFSKNWSNGTRAGLKDSTPGFVQQISPLNSYTLTNATVLGTSLSTSLLAVLNDLFDREYGSRTKVGVCGAGFYNQIQQMAYLWPGGEIQLKQETDKRGIDVGVLEFSGYKLKLQKMHLLHRTFDGYYKNHCFIIDPEHVVIAHPRGYATPQRKPKPKINNREQGWELVWKWGLKLKFPTLHGLIDLQSIATS